METIIVYLSDALKTTREKRKLTQKELSRMSGISYSTITKIETGVITNPSFFSCC
jgi:transcriptional regulator with XRE-family HTH domain